MAGFEFSLAGLLVGTVVGATGVGGGSVMTPILILFYGIPPSLAVGTDLLYASISKAFGVVLHGRRSTVDWSIVAWLSTGSVPAALLTLWLLQGRAHDAGFDQMIKLTLACAVVLTAAFTLLQDRLMRFAQQDRFAGLHRFRESGQRPLTVICGVLIGALVTISSVGAGVIGMMMLLILYPRHAPIRLVGSDLAHAVLITAIAGLGHASMGTVDLRMLGFLLLGALPGIWLGTRIAFRLDDRGLKRAISILLIVVGSTMLIKSLADLL